MEILIAVVSKVGEYLVEPMMKQLHYLCCFNNIVKNLNERERGLKSAQDRIKQEVETAENNTEIIEKVVEDWIVGASNMLTEVQDLEKEIQVNKNCLNGWCPSWGSRYWLSRKAAKKTSDMFQLIEDSGKFHRVSHPAPLPGIEFVARRDFQFFRSSQSAFNQIIEALKNDQINIVGLHGMGGTGKTTLATTMGKEVDKKMFDEVVMATVSRSPNFKKIQGELAESLGLEFRKESEVGRAKQLYLRFKESKKKSLIILDDVWEAFDLQQEIGIPCNIDHKGCKVLLTTRFKQVCIDINCQQQFQLDVLNEEEGLSLLKIHADISDDCPELNELAIQIARECGGLPLALAAIGGALKRKDNNVWRHVYRKLAEAKLEDIPNVKVSGEKGIYNCLKLSYDNLMGDKAKFCFLLCSLFPEDYKIPAEDLVRCMMGLHLYQSIEDERTDLLSTLDYLKDSSLLLDAGKKGLVKMHDVVRDVALWITSEGENVFMSKHGMRSREWIVNGEGWKKYTAISSLVNNIQELPIGLVCPKLEILFLGNDGDRKILKVPDECFGDMNALKVLNLRYMDLSLKSLQFSTNLKTLQLHDCYLTDISSLANLSKLEILSFRGSSFNELPRELTELKKLRMLDLRGCLGLNIIYSKVIQSFSYLEELYIGDSFGKWEFEGKSVERSNASLSELNSLSNLTVLYLVINAEFLPKEFQFPCHKLLRYHISVNTYCSTRYESSKKALSIKDIEATSLIAFKQLFQALEELSLENVPGCQNILPSIDQGSLNQLNSLRLRSCHDLKCIADTSQQHVPTGKTSRRLLERLKKVQISSCSKLEEMWKGPSHHVNLQSLMDVEVRGCESLTYLFTRSLAQSMVQLKSLKVSDCKSLELLVREDSHHDKGKEILPKFDDDLPCLFFWKLQSLKIHSCKKLEYIFPVFVAQGLVQLEELYIEDVPQLKQVFHLDRGREELTVAREGKDIMELPKLKRLELRELASLISFCPENCQSTWPILEDLTIEKCYNLSKSFIDEVVAKVQLLDQKLQILNIDSCNELADMVVSQLRNGFLKNLRELLIQNCGVKVMFEVEDVVIDDGQQHINLKTLRLISLPELQLLCKGPTHVLRLENLLMLEIKQCQRLRHIFTPTLAPNLLQLARLTIEECEELEEIMYEDDEEDQTLILKDYLQPHLFFPNLYSIEVKRCHKLKYLFSITRFIDAQDHPQPLFLPNLLIIEVERCENLKYLFPINKAEGLQKPENFELEQVFGHKDVADVMMDHKVIMLPRLLDLTLQTLPSLTNFCHVGYHFIFSSLGGLRVRECPKMRTRFSYRQDDKSVHAVEKAPKTGNEDESAPAEISPEPATNIIDCFRSNFRDKLPPYMENDEKTSTQQNLKNYNKFPALNPN